MTEREAFQAWALSERLPLQRLSGGRYVSVATQNAWAAWQASRKQMQEELDQAHMVLGEAYQVVGSMLSDLGQFDTDRAEHVLDNLGQMRQVHDDVLPWPSFEAGRTRELKRQEGKEQ